MAALNKIIIAKSDRASHTIFCFQLPHKVSRFIVWYYKKPALLHINLPEKRNRTIQPN